MNVIYRNPEARMELDALEMCAEGNCTVTDKVPCSDPACREKEFCAKHRETCSGCGLSFCADHAQGWLISGECGDCKIDRLVPQQELCLEEVD